MHVFITESNAWGLISETMTVSYTLQIILPEGKNVMT